MQNKANNKINFIFWGTPDVASETLEILKQHGFLPALIITNTDKPEGRKMLVTPSPTKLWAISNNIPYLQPEKLNEEFVNTLKAKDPNPDLSIVVAYGKIISGNILNLPRLGSINIHYSLLPKYRGASPVESAILNGENETGVAIQQMAYKMDSGPILVVEETAIGKDETAPGLRKRLINIGGELLVKILPDLMAGKIIPVSQNEELSTYCKKIKKEDGLINLDDDATTIYNKFRAYAHWPRTYFIKDGKRNIITDASLENSKFIIKKIIPEGKKEVEYKKVNSVTPG